jgi:hypothetical protein
MTKLTEKAYIALASSGPASTDDQLRILEKAKSSGFSVTTAFEHFVATYCGRHLQHPSYSVDSIEKMHFDIDELGADFTSDATEEYSERAHSVLIPIGEANNGHLLLMMDNEGGLYGAYDRYFTKLGEDIEDGLNAIFERRETQSIP